LIVSLIQLKLQRLLFSNFGMIKFDQFIFFKAPTSTSTPAGGDERIAQLEQENRQLKKGLAKICVCLSLLLLIVAIFVPRYISEMLSCFSLWIFCIVTEDLKSALEKLTLRVDQLEKGIL